METTDGMSHLITEWMGGSEEAINTLLAAIYDDLRRIAASQLSGERINHTLQATALVNEAVVRLLISKPQTLQSTRELIRILSHTMRQVLIDSARKKNAAKRSNVFVVMDADAGVVDPRELLLIDDALSQLSRFHPRQAQVVELKYFCGLDIEEIAALLGASTATIGRDWHAARAWLKRTMSVSTA